QTCDQWTHSLDFTESAHDLVTQNGVYVDGSGWQGSDAGTGGGIGANRYFTFPGGLRGTVTAFRVVYDRVASTASSCSLILAVNGSPVMTQPGTCDSGAGLVREWTGTVQ